MILVTNDAVGKYVNGFQVAEEDTATVATVRPRIPRPPDEWAQVIFDTVVPPDRTVSSQDTIVFLFGCVFADSFRRCRIP